MATFSSSQFGREPHLGHRVGRHQRQRRDRRFGQSLCIEYHDAGVHRRRSSNPTSGATNVQASGSILVSASEQTLLDLLSGDLTGSGQLSIGAAAGVPVITKTTEAFIGAGANVTALGLGNAIQAENGRFDISYAPYGTAVGVAQPDWQNSNLGGDSGSSLTATPSPRLGKERIATPETASVNGLAVTAVNADSIQGVGVDGGVSGSVAVNLSGSVGVITNHTDAYIGSGASSIPKTPARRANNRSWSPPETTRLSWASPQHSRSRARPASRRESS